MKEQNSVQETEENTDLIKIENEDVNKTDRKKRNPLSLVASIIGNTIFVICIVLIAFLVFSMVQSKATGGPPSIAGHQMYIVIGGSMSPTFEAGSLAILEKVEPQDIGVGDIITYRESNGVTTHRIMEVHKVDDQISFTTRGDANRIDDGSPLLAQNVIGRVIYTVPYIGLLMDFAQSKMGLLMLIIIPGALLILFELRNLIRYATEGEKEEPSKAAHDDMTGKNT